MRLRTKENSKIAILEKLSRSLTIGRRLSPGVQLKVSVWENFSVLNRWSLIAGGRLLEDSISIVKEK